jgi:hypothetical protein
MQAFVQRITQKVRQFIASLTEPQAPSVVLSQEIESNQERGVALQRSTDAVRETTKWLTGAFAAVGAALIAGLQLAKLGQLEMSRLRTIVALAGLAIALVGVGRVILKASEVLTVRYASLEDIPREQRRARFAQRGIGTVGPTLLPPEILEQVTAAIRRAWPSLVRNMAKDGKDLVFQLQQTNAELFKLEEDLRNSQPDGAGQDSSLAFQLLRNRERRLDQSIDLVLAFANDCTARLQFIGFRKTCVRAGAAVAFGAVLLAWGLNPPSPTAAAPGPRAVNVYLWKPVSNELRASLGEDCVRRPYIPAVAIGGSLEEPLVVLDPSTSECTARRITITRKRGVALPSVSTTTTTLSTTTTTTVLKP